MAGPLIVTAALGPADLALLDGLRRRHYPATRNRVPAHLTLFHALPPSAEPEVRRALASACSAPSPRASVTGLMDLGRGVAVRVRSDELVEIRAELAERFHGLLTAQDSGGWAPHVTIQNKAERGQVRELLRSLEAEIGPRPLAIRGLLLFRYLDGPWEPLAGYRFRGG